MEKIEDEIVTGGWRCLCIGVLLHAIHQVESNGKIFRPDSHRVGRASGTDKDAMFNRRAAEKWFDGGRGVVTFEDCCEVMNINPEQARSKIKKRAWDNRRCSRVLGIPDKEW
jgi:hypothetical protein